MLSQVWSCFIHSQSFLQKERKSSPPSTITQSFFDGVLIMFLKLFTPTPPLHNYISKLWVFGSDQGIPTDDMRLVVPNGEIKLIIPYKNGLKSIINKDNTLARESSIVLIGLADVPAVIDSHTTDEIGTVGVEFKPFAAYRFFHLPLKELTNKVYMLDDVLGPSGVTLQKELSDCETNEERIRKIESFLMKLLAKNNRTDLIVDFAIEQIMNSHGQVTIEALSKKTGYSRRYLELKFAEKVGLSPKTLASIARFQRFYQAWGRFRENRFFEQDFYEYYYDQSHFIKEFKRFTGMAPTPFSKNDNEFGRIFYREQ